MQHTLIFSFGFVLFLFSAQACQSQSADYRSTVQAVFEDAAESRNVSDDSLIASYPTTDQEYAIQREVMREVDSVVGRDSLIAARIIGGNREVLRAHLRYASLIEGDEAMWYVEELDAMLFDIPLETICELKREAVNEIGEDRFTHTRGLIENCRAHSLW
jgi:hypothetical protein